MKIGILGTYPRDEVVTPHRDMAVSGIYPAQKTPPRNGSPVYSSMDAFMADSDVLFIARDAPSVYEITKEGVKATRHLFFEFPFILSQDQLAHLYGLSAESRSLVQLNQSLLHHPLYEAVKQEVAPGQVVVRIDSPTHYQTPESMQGLIFEVASMLKDVVGSGVRSFTTHVIQTPAESLVPGSYQLNLAFDNGCHALMLVNHLTEKESFGVEFFQEGTHYELDMLKGEALNYERARAKSRRLKKAAPDYSQLTNKAFHDFLVSINQSRLPLTINEQGETAYNLARSLIQDIHYKRRLFS